MCDHSFIVVFQCAHYTNWPKVCGQFSAFFVCVLDVCVNFLSHCKGNSYPGRENISGLNDMFLFTSCSASCDLHETT